VSSILGYHVWVAARRRQDSRLLLVSLALLTGAGFLGLHALATTGVLVGPNAGFELATPIELVIGSLFAAASAIEYTQETSRRILVRAPALLGALVALIAGWMVVSLAEFPPLDAAVPEEALAGWQLGFAAVACWAAGRDPGGTGGCSGGGWRRSCSPSPWRSYCSPSR